MRKILFLLISIFTFANTCFANITNTDNQISSFNDIKLNDFIYGVLYKKYDNNHYIQMKLLHTLNKRGYVVTLEDAQFVTDISKTYLPIRTSEVYCGFRQKFSIKLDNQTIDLLKNSNKLSIIVPFYKDGSDTFVKYQSIDIPNNILDEWKQVINM